MSNSLSKAEIEQFHQSGLLHPKRVLSSAEAGAALRELQDYEASSGGSVQGKWRYKSHLVFPFINRLMRADAILDLVADLIGPDLLVWTSHLYPKEPGDGRFISWHQDAAHWGLDSDQVVTVWIALTPVNQQNGCMRMLAGSHRLGIVEHADTWDPANILTRGQTITQEIDESRAVALELEAGECSLHHVNMFHASHANYSSDRRVGLALRYITPQARQQRVDQDFATLVRGEDRYGHFVHEAAPEILMQPEFVQLHSRISDIQGQIYLDGTARAGLAGLTETNVLRNDD
jgi:non-haem Fe2+, alpha-ketoglutarate-dependent halogenase